MATASIRAMAQIVMMCFFMAATFWFNLIVFGLAFFNWMEKVLKFPFRAAIPSR
jgi:hypothetical protein